MPRSRSQRPGHGCGDADECLTALRGRIGDRGARFAAFRFAVNALGESAPSAQRGQVFATLYIVSYLAFSVPALVAGLAVGRLGLEPTAVAYGALEFVLVLIATAAGLVQARRRARPLAHPAS